MKLLKSGLVLALALAAFSSTALAATGATGAAATAGPDCEQTQAATGALVAQLGEAKDAQERRAILAPGLKTNPSSAICLMRSVRTDLPKLAKPILEDVIAILSLDPANEDLIKKLTEEFGDLLADAGNIEPAAGDEETPGGGDEDFGPGDNGPGENPSQLNDPSSPSAPII